MILKSTYNRNLQDFLNSELLSHTDLHIDLNQSLTSKKCLSSLCSSLEKCTNLQNLTLNVKKNKISNEGVIKLVSSLEKCSKISNLSLDLSYNQIVESGSLKIGQSLAKFSDLSNLTLILSENQIGQQDASLLCQDLKKCSKLQYLNLGLDSNSISQAGAQHLCKILAQYQNLSKLILNLNNNSLGLKLNDVQDCINLSNLEFNISDLTLNLNNNKIGDTGASELGYVLAKGKKLSNLRLDLTDNQIDKGVLGLGSGLEQCTNLQNLTLILSFNQIGDKSVSGLGDSLAQLHIKQTEGVVSPGQVSNLGKQTQHSNQALDLNTNKIGNQDTSKLCSDLTKRTYLRNLVLELNNTNKIGDEGISILCSNLTRCTYLQNLKLILNKNQISANCVVVLASIFAKFSHLQNLTLEIEVKNIKTLSLSPYSKFYKSLRLVTFQIQIKEQEAPKYHYIECGFSEISDNSDYQQELEDSNNNSDV